MGGNKKNGNKKKKKEQEEKDVLTEVDREYYEIQLNDLNRKLNRLKSKCEDLETLNLQLEENIKILDEDRSDIIAFLKKNLISKTNELSELQERFDGLKQSMESGVVSYKEKITNMEQEYKNMQNELTSEIKLLMGKLNSLEEFRTQKEELTSKFLQQEKKMREQEEKHKKNLYENEKKFILEKNKLKKEMETRLLKLSLEFQKATDLRMASTTHKMIRENIAVNNELTTMQESQIEMIKENEKMKKLIQEIKINGQLVEEEKNMVLKKNLTLIKVIEDLIKKREEDEEKIKKYYKMEKYCQTLKNKLNETDDKLKEANGEIKKLSERLSTGQTNAAKLYADIAALKLNSRRLYGILHRAVNAVKDALRIHETPEESEEIILSKRLALLNNLLQILNRAEMSEKERYL
ncbi:Centrosome protein, putative [Pediculus humanus corporis]|uniref:Cilia- and flagella-associated protein 157 n=1 Tax=Pediculus humanus subsp. corporis TaxID=121224 RepID=E0VPN1_PEDHC|nr:Centrosome protein, putative [Pediculus humanus corporis]EEB15337.1 Centrosome protein, putative [Pediculus humanus corporis]